LHFGWFSKSKRFWNEALTRGRVQNREREGAKERNSLIGEADCGKIAFPHYDEIKVPSRSSTLFLPVPPSYIRTAINPRRLHWSRGPRYPRGDLQSKRKVRVHERSRDSVRRSTNNYFPPRAQGQTELSRLSQTSNPLPRLDGKKSFFETTKFILGSRCVCMCFPSLHRIKSKRRELYFCFNSRC